MDIQPASISQLREAENGQLVEISADVGGVVAGLQRIDAGLKVRLSERGQCFIVRHENHGDCPHNCEGGPGSAYLVKTVQAHRNGFGTWEGLDQRLVDRLLEIGHSSYDYVRALEERDRQAEKARRDRFAEEIGGTAEQAAHALRRDLGERYRGRIFVP